MAYWVDRLERFRPGCARVAPTPSLISRERSWPGGVRRSCTRRGQRRWLQRPLILFRNRCQHPRLQRPPPTSAKDFCGAIANAGKQFRHAFESDFIARIGYEANKRGDILDMRLLEEPDATGDSIRYAAP